MTKFDLSCQLDINFNYKKIKITINPTLTPVFKLMFQKICINDSVDKGKSSNQSIGYWNNTALILISTSKLKKSAFFELDKKIPNICIN